MRVFLTVALLAFIPSCAVLQVEDVVQFQQGRGQEVHRGDGDELVVSRARSSVVTLRPATKIVDSRPFFVLGIQNVSKRPIEIHVSDITAFELAEGKLGSPLKVYSHDELLGETKLRHLGAQFVTALAAGNLDDETGSWDAGNQLIAEGHAQRENETKALEEFKMVDKTLAPGETFAGQFAVASPNFTGSKNDKAYAIKIAVGPDRHEIRVTQTSVKPNPVSPVSINIGEMSFPEPTRNDGGL